MNKQTRTMISRRCIMLAALGWRVRMHFHQWKRREFITLLGGAAAWPLSAAGQAPSKRPLIGLLAAGAKTPGSRYYGAFPLGLREMGYLEGRDYMFEERYADGDPVRLPLLAEELVRM